MAVHVRFQETFPLRASEWALAFIMFSWGLICFSYPGMFTSNYTFSGMAAMASQQTWAVGALVMGSIGLVALAINGFWRATPFIRAACAALRAGMWLTITFGLFATDNPTTGLAIYPWLFILDMWNIYRAMSDARSAV